MKLKDHLPSEFTNEHYDSKAFAYAEVEVIKKWWEDQKCWPGPQKERPCVVRIGQRQVRGLE